MSRMSDLSIDIQDAVEQGELSYVEIAEKFNVTYSEVRAVADSLIEYYDYLAQSSAAADVGCEFDPKVA